MFSARTNVFNKEGFFKKINIFEKNTLQAAGRYVEDMSDGDPLNRLRCQEAATTKGGKSNEHY